jgi:hypothetical protein
MQKVLPLLLKKENQNLKGIKKYRISNKRILNDEVDFGKKID